MRKIYIKFLLIVVSVSMLAGCATAPEHQARIDTCSREANAYTPGQRFRNGGYWSCLEREENSQKYQQAQQQQAAYFQQLQYRCDSFGFNRGTTAHSNCMVNQQQQDRIAAENAQVIQIQQQQQAQQKLNDAVRMLSPPQPTSITCFRAPGSPVTTCN